MKISLIFYIITFMFVFFSILIITSFLTFFWLIILCMLLIIFIFFAINKVFLRMLGFRSRKKQIKHNKIFLYSITKTKIILFFTIVLLSNTISLHATNNQHNKFDVGKVIIGHIVDSYEWHIATIGDKHISIYLPVILFYEGRLYIFSSKHFAHGQKSHLGFKIENEGIRKGKIVRVLSDGITTDPNASYIIDLSITRNVVGIFIATLVVLVLFLFIARRYKKNADQAPKGLQNLIEIIIIFLRDQTIKPAIGQKHYMRFMPYLLTLFFFILFANLIGLVPFFPGGSNITGNLAVTGTLALFTFVTVLVSGNKNFYQHLFNTPGVPWFMKIPIPLMPIVELLGLLTKPFVLMVRLFANITAGHIVSLGFISLIFIFAQINPLMGFSVSPISIVLYFFITMLELLVAFIQAYVFTILSALYIGIAVEEHHNDHEKHISIEIANQS